MAMKHSRLLMINTELQKILSSIIQKECAAVGTLITITEIQTTPDLYHARVYLSIYGKTSKKAILKKLTTMAPYLQHLVGQEITLRRIPKFSFTIDPSLEHADHIEQLLKTIHL